MEYLTLIPMALQAMAVVLIVEGWRTLRQMRRTQKAQELRMRATDLAAFMVMNDRQQPGERTTPAEKADRVQRYLRGRGAGHGGAYRAAAGAVLAAEGTPAAPVPP